MTARNIISAAQAYDLPDPTGPLIPRTKLSSCKNFQTVGDLLKSKFKPGNSSIVIDLICIDINDVRAD